MEMVPATTRACLVLGLRSPQTAARTVRLLDLDCDDTAPGWRLTEEDLKRTHRHNWATGSLAARFSGSAYTGSIGQHLGRDRARIRMQGMLSDRRRCASDEDLATLVSGSRADVDDVVGLRDHPEVVLDNDHRRAVIDQATQLAQQ